MENITLNKDINTFATAIGLWFIILISWGFISYLILLLLWILKYILPCITPIYNCCYKIQNAF